jgi:hypothetical protein
MSTPGETENELHFAKDLILGVQESFLHADQTLS